MGDSSATLTPDSRGQVYISTDAIFRALITAQFIGAEADFTYATPLDGYQPTGVKVDADGSVTWVLGNLGQLQVIRLTEGAYNALGWNITVAEDGGMQITRTETGKAFIIHPQCVEAF